MGLRAKMMTLFPIMRRVRTFRRAAYQALGRHGEEAACRLLRALGMTILARNYRCGHHEIDIVALDGARLCFVEVKTQLRFNPFKRPRDKLSVHQKRRIISCAKRYRQRNHLEHVPYRFDVVEIILRPGLFGYVRYARLLPGYFSPASVRSRRFFKD